MSKSNLPSSVVTGTLIPPTTEGVTSFTSAVSGSSAPYTGAISIPTVSNGNELWLLVSTSNSVTTPTGWTLATSDTAGDAKLYLYKRIVDGTEGASLTVSFANNNQVVMHLVAVGGQTTGEVVGTTAHQTGGASSITASVATPLIECLVLAFQVGADASSMAASPPTGWTELADANAQYGYRQASVAWNNQPTAATINATWSITGGTGALAMVLVAIPSANYKGPLFTKADVIATGIDATDISAAQLGTDGKLLPSQSQPGAYGTWSSLGELGVMGQVTAMSISPHDSRRVLVGGDMLGVGLSTDQGNSWQPTYGFNSWEICSFTWHPTDPTQVWCATLSGPYLSKDSGHNWARSYSGMPTTDYPYSAPTGKVMYDPADPTYQHMWVFFGCHRRFSVSYANLGQVYESTNGGTSWTLKSTALVLPPVSGDHNSGHGGIMDVAISNGRIIAAPEANGIYYSDDSGATWTASSATFGSGQQVTATVAHPTTSGTLFCAADTIYKSTDNGVTWAAAGNCPTYSSLDTFGTDYFNTLAIGSDGLTMYASTYTQHALRSLDGGTTWATIGQSSSTIPSLGYPQAQVATGAGAISIAPSNPKIMIMNTLGDIIRTSDGGNTFDSASAKLLANGKKTGRGYSGLLGVRTVFSKYVEGTLFINAFDGGNILRSTDGGLSWAPPTGRPSSYYGAYDTSIGGPTGQVVWSSFGQQGSFMGIGISTDGGATFTTYSGTSIGLIAASSTNTSATKIYNAVRPISPDGLSAVATIGGNIYRTTNSGAAWTTVTGHSFTDLHIDRTTLSASGASTTVYASGSSGVYVSTDGGQTWTAVSGSPINGSSNYLAGDPNDHTKVYLACWQPSDYTTHEGVWRYDTGAGSNPQGWTRLLTNYSTRMVAVDPLNSSRIAVCTDDNPSHANSYATGVYISTDGGSTWTQYNTGLRMLRIWSIAWDPFKPGRLICGTNGGGYFVTHLPPDVNTTDGRNTNLPFEQLDQKAGYHEKSFGYLDMGDTLPGPLETVSITPRVGAAQGPARIMKTSQTAAYQLVAADIGTIVEVNSSSAVTVTIPAALTAWSANTGDDIFFVRQIGVGQVTIAGASGVTVTGYPSGAVKTAGQNATISVSQRAQDTWIVDGRNST